jgi:hypothetical protein
LSSQTNSSGNGSLWYAQCRAAFSAPSAVEWFAEASPKLHITIASAGHGEETPSLPARCSPNASPTARGRCEAMVEVSGMIDSALLPNTLCLPPAIGSSAAAVTPHSTSRSGLLPGT